MRVTQLINNNGNAAANQFVLNNGKSEIFQSYNTLIAKVTDNNIYLDPKWCCSQTTLKHLKIFLNTPLTKSEIQKKIDQGVYKLKNLNK